MTGIASESVPGIRSESLTTFIGISSHYIENTGDTDVMFLEMFKSDQFVDVSLNNWLRRMPPEAVTAHLNLNQEQIAEIPAEKELVIPG